jgi:hypothetical protein
MGSRFRLGSAGPPAWSTVRTATPPTSPARTDSIGNPATGDGGIVVERMKGSYESQLAFVEIS